MKEIAKNIYLEDSYDGVVLGAIKLDHGLLLLDSPLRPPDQTSWRRKVAQIGDGSSWFTLMLDAHIDRTLGLGGLGGRILGQAQVVEILADRPAALRSQEIEPGAEAEALDPQASFRWPIPNMTFSNRMAFYTDEGPVTIAHRPGAHLAGCWVQIDAAKVLFVGDSVVAHQPPFLAWSDLNTWQAELAELQSGPLQDYRVISSRNGLVDKQAIRKFAEFLSDVKAVLADIASQENREGALADLLPRLLRKIGSDKRNANLFQKRLAHGMAQHIQPQAALNKNK